MMNNEYLTKDLGEVAALLTEKCSMKGIMWKDDTAYFRFHDSSKCKEISQQYFFQNLAVNARFYYENIRMVKKKLYAEQKGGASGYVQNKR